jgi:hypothetical protein
MHIFVYKHLHNLNELRATGTSLNRFQLPVVYIFQTVNNVKKIM